MAEGQDQEKTEQPTPKKRDDARKKGQIAQSREIRSFADSSPRSRPADRRTQTRGGSTGSAGKTT